ncbi:hypothetical protein ACIBJI_13400 [Nocardia sp. NPDC050408]|uniref:hypothetical protein n=1 Tax=unclassified Nocardia TaxID=2637762 RepID=UPI00344232E5
MSISDSIRASMACTGLAWAGVSPSNTGSGGRESSMIARRITLFEVRSSVGLAVDQVLYASALQQSPSRRKGPRHRPNCLAAQDRRDLPPAKRPNSQRFWRKTAEEILESLAKYLQRISGAGH